MTDERRGVMDEGRRTIDDGRLTTDETGLRSSLVPRPSSLANAIAIALAVGLPWTTFLLGWAPSGQAAIQGTPMLLFLCGGLAIVCCWVAETDKLLGLFGLWMVVRAGVTLGPPLIESAMYVVMGIAIIAAVQRWTRECTRDEGTRDEGRIVHRLFVYRPSVPVLFAAAGAAQIAYAALQWTHPLNRWWVAGTFGNPGMLGAYLAMTVAFAPWWAVPFWALGLWLSKSVAAVIAAGVALALRVALGRVNDGRCTRDEGRRLSSIVYRPSSLLVAAALVAFAALWMRGFDVWNSVATRLEGHSMALGALLPAADMDVSSIVSRLSSLVFGYGPGSWAILAEPMTRYSGSIGPGYEIPMHCEPLQLLFEGGFIAVALAGAWIWIHRRELVGTLAGAGVVAVLVDSLWSFPFHVATIAASACVLMGMATATTSRQQAAGSRKIQQAAGSRQRAEIGAVCQLQAASCQLASERSDR